jgi:hypothetical protein
MNHILNTSDFEAYPPQAKRFANDHIATLQELPPILCALLLKEISQYDWQFPAERSDLASQLQWIKTADRRAVNSVVAPFAALQISGSVLDLPWARQPETFIERLTTDLWMTHSIDAFYRAGKRYGEVLDVLRREQETSTSRLCIVFIGSGSDRGQQSLFEKLRSHGTYFSRVDLSDGLAQAIAAIEDKSGVQHGSYQHWYVDGDSPEPHAQLSELESRGISCVSYAQSAPLRRNIVEAMNAARTSGIAGPEQLRTLLARMRLQDDVQRQDQDEVMKNFILRLYTEGSGTQIFSTTFVQWAGREILRRARPQTLLLRFRLRQIERTMDELLGVDSTKVSLDPRGSLIDADMGAFYTWINLQRLPGADRSRFIVCFENGSEALAVAPGLPKGTISDSKCSLQNIVTWAA